MAQLFWTYASMNSGKSSSLLQVNHNYKELGMKTLLITAKLDDRYGEGKITSRIGLSCQAETFDANTNMVDLVSSRSGWKEIDCILVDEAQFLSRKQVEQLADIVDLHDIPVMAYGLRNDFKGVLFEGSSALFSLADKVKELKGLCHCGRKSTMVLKYDSNGNVASLDSPQIEIGGNDKYVSLCRKHYMEFYGGTNR